MKELFELKEKYWIKVSPLARAAYEWLVASVYKKCKISWITECCGDFSSPEDAYEWGFNCIRQIEAKNDNAGL